MTAAVVLRALSAFGWSADNGNGTYSNPLFYEDFPDPSMIRIGEDYYLTGTSMHAMPGLPILHSRDLVNWKLIGYAFDRLDLGPAMRLEGGEIYGQGIWAPCLCHRDGMFYIFANVNGFGTQVYRAERPEGPWQHHALPVSLHDVSVLFDGEKSYAVYGCNEIRIVELTADLKTTVSATDRVLIPAGRGMGEGSHAYKIGGRYYIVGAIGGAHTPMVCGRADRLEGPWEVTAISVGENQGIGMSYRIKGDERAEPPCLDIVSPDVNEGGGLTLHQGGLIDTPSGEWWGYSMMDHNAIGRLTCLSPVTWKDGWPFFGLPGNLRRSPVSWVKPNIRGSFSPAPLTERSDDFKGARLKPVWQWNHAPDNARWSLAERPGWLRLHPLSAKDFWWARNTLTQRAVGPESSMTVRLDASGLAVGDVAGLGLLTRPYAWIGVARTASGWELRLCDQARGGMRRKSIPSPRIWIRAHCNFDCDQAELSSSADGQTFEPWGDPVKLVFQIKTFQGVRYSLFGYGENGPSDGYADFTSCSVDEPRPRGLTAPIPSMQPVVFSEQGNGRILAVRNGMLKGVAASEAAEGDALTVVVCGPGRVALRTADGCLVSVAASSAVESAVGLERKDAPETAEMFQWVDMQRGDLMLLSLVTHRYLRVQQDGTVTADHPGPSPDRRDGSCFGWRQTGPAREKIKRTS